MITKNILKYLAASLVFCGFAAAFTSCSSDEDPFFTAGEEDAPRILNTNIPEGKGGEPAVLMSIDRTQNFEFEVFVTPAQYTTVTWLLDGEQIFEGTKIDMPLLAGDHILEIVATTTLGKTTSRICQVIVRPVEGDPELASDAKSRWLTIGTTKTIKCKNVTSVSKVFIGKQEATNVSFANGKLTFDVPAMTESDYMVTIEADGARYGCGWFTVSSEEYVDPGIKETVIWEGSVDINWGDSNVFLSPEEMAQVPVGATIRLEYEIITADYHALRITNQDWSSDIVPQIDGFENQPNPYEFTYTADHKAIADAKGMLITGFGYKLTKVVAVEGAAPAETTLWEGDPVDINWGDANVFISPEEMAKVPVGATIRLEYEIITADYHALRITNQDWSSDIVPQIDGFENQPNPYEFTYTADHKAIADAKGMLITGFGYKLTKVVAVEGAAPAETTLWEGDPVDINWGDANVFISPEEMANVPVGATISLQYEIITADYHALRITNQDWSSDIVPQIDGFENQPNPFEFTYTADHKAIVDGNGMLITGFGYKLTKVTYK